MAEAQNNMVKQIKKGIIEKGKGLMCKFMYAGDRSWCGAPTHRLDFSEYIVPQLNSTTVLHELKSGLLAAGKLPNGAFQENQWSLSLRKYKFKDGKLSGTKYDTIAVPSYELWNHIDLADLRHDAVWLAFKCSESQTALKKVVKAAGGGASDAYKRVRDGKKAVERAQREDSLETQILKQWQQNMINNPDLWQIRRLCEEKPQYLAWVVNKTKFANGAYGWKDAILDLSQRLKEHQQRSAQHPANANIMEQRRMIPRNKALPSMSKRRMTPIMSKHANGYLRKKLQSSRRLKRVPHQQKRASSVRMQSFQPDNHQPQPLLSPAHVVQQDAVTTTNSALIPSQETTQPMPPSQHIKKEPHASTTVYEEVMDKFSIMAQNMQRLQNEVIQLKIKNMKTQQLMTVCCTALVALSHCAPECDGVHENLMSAVKLHGDWQLVHKLKHQKDCLVLNDLEKGIRSEFSDDFDDDDELGVIHKEEKDIELSNTKSEHDDDDEIMKEMNVTPKVMKEMEIYDLTQDANATLCKIRFDRDMEFVGNSQMQVNSLSAKRGLRKKKQRQ
eukprot:24789_1